MWLPTASSFWFCLKGLLAQRSSSAGGPRATSIHLPANPAECSFAFQSIHKNTARLWSLKSVYSLPDNFKAALEEDKHKSLASHRNTGISVPTSLGGRDPARCTSKAAVPAQGRGAGTCEDSLGTVRHTWWSPWKAVRGLRAPQQEREVQGAASSPTPNRGWGGGEKKSCPQITDQTSSPNSYKPLLLKAMT